MNIRDHDLPEEPGQVGEEACPLANPLPNRDIAMLEEEIRRDPGDEAAGNQAESEVKGIDIENCDHSFSMVPGATHYARNGENR